jgi:hypothetical protein
MKNKIIGPQLLQFSILFLMMLKTVAWLAGSGVKFEIYNHPDFKTDEKKVPNGKPKIAGLKISPEIGCLFLRKRSLPIIFKFVI